MAQKTVLSLLALPTGPARTFLAKATAPTGVASALRGDLSVIGAFLCSLVTTSAYTCSLNVTPAFTAELRVTNVSA